MRVASVPVLILASLLFIRSAWPAETPCAGLHRQLSAYLAATSDGAALRRLAKHAGPDLATAMLARLPAADPGLAFELLVAAGLSGESDALRHVRAAPVPASAEARVGRALALLALGDDSNTTTVAKALEDGADPLRLRVAMVLGELHQPRPRALLHAALDDDLAEVRLVAAESLIRIRSAKARRVLMELARVAPEPLKLRASRALASARFSSAGLEALPETLGVRSLARGVALGRPEALRRARSLAASVDAEQRAAGLAALVAGGQETPAGLEKLLQRSLERSGGVAKAQLAMALALLGDPRARDLLSSLPPSDIKPAVEVLLAMAPAVDVPLGALRWGPIAFMLEQWIVSGTLPDPEAARAIEAAALLAGAGARGLARARLLGPDGPGFAAAAGVLGRVGSPEDVPALVDAAKRVSIGSKLEAFAAAQARCAE